MRSATACTHTECVTQLEFITKTWKEWFTYAANTFPQSSSRFNTHLTKPILPHSEKTNHVQQLFSCQAVPLAVPQMSPCSSLMFSHLLEVPESPQHRIITYSSPFKSNRLHWGFFSANLIHHQCLTSLRRIRAKEIHHLHLSSHKQCKTLIDLAA